MLGQVEGSVTDFKLQAVRCHEVIDGPLAFDFFYWHSSVLLSRERVFYRSGPMMLLSGSQRQALSFFVTAWFGLVFFARTLCTHDFFGRALWRRFEIGFSQLPWCLEANVVRVSGIACSKRSGY